MTENKESKKEIALPPTIEPRIMPSALVTHENVEKIDVIELKKKIP
jgi:hypothetical protein